MLVQTGTKTISGASKNIWWVFIIAPVFFGIKFEKDFFKAKSTAQREWAVIILVQLHYNPAEFEEKVMAKKWRDFESGVCTRPTLPQNDSCLKAHLRPRLWMVSLK